jgi:hypothetical protein
MVVEAQRHLTVRDILVDGIGGTLPEIAATRLRLDVCDQSRYSKANGR